MKQPVTPRAVDMMNPKPLVLSHDTMIHEAATVMWKRQVPVAVVVDAGIRPLGILSQQGIMLAMLDVVHHERPTGPVTDYLDPATQSVAKNMPLMQVAEIFVRRGYALRALPVICDDNLCGLIWRRDIVHAVIEYLKGVKHDQLGRYLEVLKDAEDTSS